MNLDFAQINWLAVIVAAVAAFLIGGMWYTALFGKAWQKAHHIDEQKMKDMQATRPMHVFLAMQFVCYCVIAVGMALLINGAEIHTIGGGATLGLRAWLLVGAVMLTNHLPTATAWAGYLIDVSFAAIYCVGIGALLGAWQ